MILLFLYAQNGWRQNNQMVENEKILQDVGAFYMRDGHQAYSSHKPSHQLVSKYASELIELKK